MAATGDFKLVFSRKFIKHWFILGTINFVFQYLASCLDVGFARLFVNYFNSIFVIGLILKLYLNIFINKNFSNKLIFYTVLFNIVTTLFVIMFSQEIISYNYTIYEEIIVNFIIKILQFLLLYIFYKEVGKNEKFCKKYFM